MIISHISRERNKNDPDKAIRVLGVKMSYWAVEGIGTSPSHPIPYDMLIP
jgi:hypothetical protein